jgi:DNA replication and repair protein RecF
MIAEIRLQQFRSYPDKTFKLSSGLNVVVGPNASGKTNLLEAIMVICTGNSFRAPDNELVMYGKQWSRIDAKTSQGNRTLKLTTTNKEFLLEGKSHKNLNHNTQIPLVLFEPYHLLMISGAPELRRNYLDGVLDSIQPDYKKIRKNYHRTLRQRNTLLKKGHINNNELFPWNVRLSQIGGIIANSRAKLITKLNETLTESYQKISDGKEKITLKYKTNIDLSNYESQLVRKLEQTIDLDLIKGFTMYGPHREDMKILVNNKDPNLFYSRGETRTLVVALKISELKTVSLIKKDPIILLDDVFSELDSKRQQALAAFLSTNTQSLITTTEINNNNLHKKGVIIKTT